MTRQRILIAEDYVRLAEAFRKLLEPEFEVLGIVSDGRTLLREAMLLRPDLITLDLSMPSFEVNEARRQLAEFAPHTKLLIVTMNEDPEIAASALSGWAHGYVLKKSASSELVHAVREVLAGRQYMTPRLVR
ncbi:response regulator [Terriglobus roseus]|uniref:Response regulator receiver domain-containing protein n=1 Tax=Terriglobus roseus TaxID=392734 RepID=A0A1G7HNV2_9BACT|nr:response regulator transcription factor [Terriglobus roseus]SDF02117.1 Response regulator receiver domain-containing protein [Terriglobus roseus]